MSQKKALAAIAAVVCIAICLSVYSSGLLGILVAQQTVPSNGNISGTSGIGVGTGGSGGGSGGNGLNSTIDIGVYTDQGTTNNCTSISWGNISPGGTINQTVYVKNTGNTAETLNMTTSNWSPSIASQYLTITWNQEGTILQPDATVAATLTLTAAADTENLTNFGFNIAITGSAQ